MPDRVWSSHINGLYSASNLRWSETQKLAEGNFPPQVSQCERFRWPSAGLSFVEVQVTHRTVIKQAHLYPGVHG